jgi:hypothetical protein
MMRKVSLLLGLTLAIISIESLQIGRSQDKDDRVKWVMNSLKEMETIKVGMTRADLLRVFAEEGGLSTRRWRQYVYQKCPYFKVKVEFEPVGEPEGPNSMESSRDKIVRISQPFLEWSVLD